MDDVTLTLTLGGLSARCMMYLCLIQAVQSRCDLYKPSRTTVVAAAARSDDRVNPNPNPWWPVGTVHDVFVFDAGCSKPLRLVQTLSDDCRRCSSWQCRPARTRSDSADWRSTGIFLVYNIFVEFWHFANFNNFRMSLPLIDDSNS